MKSLFSCVMFVQHDIDVQCTRITDLLHGNVRFMFPIAITAYEVILLFGYVSI